MQSFNNVHSAVCTLFCIIFIHSDISCALRDVRVQIPHAVKKSEKAILQCLYDLEGDSLYSVKWYKGRREFYSFTPKENPAMKVFQFAGVKVDRSSSNESQLVLESVNVATSGKYSCEVSADAPSFHTLIGAGELEVVVPGRDPVISGIRPRYKVGDIVRGNCTSTHSRPAANITWTVNGFETNPAHIRHFKPHKERELETVISAIHFVVTPQHFIYGKLKIRCTAFIHDVYWKSTEKSIEENRLSKSDSANVVHKFSEDYFDLDEDNIVDRSDTYMTHIKGDVSSLNANGCSALHACFWPRLTTLSLILYAVQQLFQLLLQLLSQTTATEMEKSKQHTGNCQTLTTNNRACRGNGTNVLQTKITAATTTAAIKQQTVELNTMTSLATEVSTICYENKSTAEYWPSEKYFHIKSIKKKHQPNHYQQQLQQHQHQLKAAEEKERQLQSKYTNSPILQREQVQSQMHLRSQLQLEADKTRHKHECNLTTTAIPTQVANIPPPYIAPSVLVLTILQYFRYKFCSKLYNSFAHFYSATAPKSWPNSLNAVTCRLAARPTGNSVLRDLFLNATEYKTTST